MPGPRFGRFAGLRATGNKFGNTKVKLDGFTFDSKREAAIYAETMLRVKAGEIDHVEVHPRYDIIVNGVRIGFYKADLQWREKDGRLRTIDVKNPATAKDPYFRLKLKLIEALYPGVKIEVVF